MKHLFAPLIVLLLMTALVTAQEEETTDLTLTLSVTGESCVLELSTSSGMPHGASPTQDSDSAPEATPEATDEPETTPEPTADRLPDLPTYTLSDDCEAIERLLQVASNGTLWLALLIDDADDWLHLDILEDDPYPPQLDARGRYFGCAIPDEGEQTCYVLVTLEEADYLVAVPLWVGDAYYAQPVETDEPESQETQETQETPEPPTGDNPPPQDTGGNNPQPTATDDKPPEGEH